MIIIYIGGFENYLDRKTMFLNFFRRFQSFSSILNSEWSFQRTIRQMKPGKSRIRDYMQRSHLPQMNLKIDYFGCMIAKAEV
jgi:hypothetical protein